MTYPRRAARTLPTRVRAVIDVSDHMRQIEVAGPDLPLLRCRPGAHLVVRVPDAPGPPGVFESAGAGDEMPGADGVPPLPWVHRGPASAVASRVLLRAVQELDLPAGPGAAYVAGESDTCRLVRRHLVEQRGWPRRAVLMQPQWTPGRAGFGAGGD